MNRLFWRLVCFGFVMTMGLQCDSNSDPVAPDSSGVLTAAIQGVVRIGGSPAGGVAVALTGPGATRTSTSGNDGAFTFTDLSPGLYTMTATLAGVTCRSTTAEMKAGESVTTSIDCASAQPHLTASLTGTVTVGDTPLGGAQVTLVSYFSPAGRSVTTDSTGHFTFAELTQSELYLLTAEALGFACESTVVSIASGRTATADIPCAEEHSGGGQTIPPPMAGMGKIAFERSGRVMVLDLNTNNLFHFIDGLAPSWSPDGRRLAIQRPACLDRSLPPYFDCDDIWVVNADGSGLSAVTNYEWVLDQDPVWSPDGSQVAFVRFVHGPDQSYLVVADVDPPSALWSETVASVWHPISNPTWSPDGTRIVFTCEGPPPRWEFDLCAVPSTRDLGYQGGQTGGVRRITTGTWVDSDPAWSPDGTRLAFTTDREAAGRSYVALVGADGSGYEALVVGKDPAWSPDGTRIVFVGDADPAGLHIVNRDGTGLVQITDDPADAAPSWGR
jgi:hypothetical protein